MPAGGKRRYCESYRVFRKNVERSRAYLRIYEGASGRSSGAPTSDERELLRGAVVFAVGALDNFIHELILELVPRFGGDRDQLHEAFRAIAKDDPAISLRVALAPTDDARRAELERALERWLESKSFQGVPKVLNGLQYVGCTDATRNFPADWRKDLGSFTEDRTRSSTGARN